MALAPMHQLIPTVVLAPIMIAASAPVAENLVDTEPEPSPLATLVEVGADKQITARKDLEVRIRTIGSAFKAGYTELPTALWIKSRMPCHAWELIHYDRAGDIDPREIICELDLPSGTTVDLAWRGRHVENRWLPHQWTLEECTKVLCLKNGDSFPSELRDINDGAIDNFLAQHLGKAGRVVLGPRELLYLLEFGPGGPADEGPDFRDLALVVSFHEADQPTENKQADHEARENNPPQDKGLKPTGSLSGIDPTMHYEDVPPFILTLSNLPPQSATYLRTYAGPAHDAPHEDSIEFIAESYVWIEDDVPQDRRFTLKDLNNYFTKEGIHTVELIHETPGSTTVLSRTQIQVDRTFLLPGGLYILD